MRSDLELSEISSKHHGTPSVIYHLKLYESEVQRIIELVSQSNANRANHWLIAGQQYGYQSLTLSKLPLMPRGGKREGAGKKAADPGNPRSELFSKRVTVDEKKKLEAYLEELRKPSK